MTKIAVFDPGRNLGVLKAPLREKAAIVHGVTLYTAKLRDTTDLGAYLKSADDPIREALRGVEVASIESPNTQGSNHSGIVKNVALASHISYWCSHSGIAVRWFNLRHAKVILTDNGNAKKPEMIAAAEFLLGLQAGALTEHEADVYGGWLVESFGVAESSSARQARRATERRLAREAAKAAALEAARLKKLTEGLNF